MVHFVDILQFVYDCLIQSVTSRSRELVLKKGTGKMLSQKQYRYRYWKEFGTSTGKLPGIFHFLGGTGISIGKNWSGKKVPVAEKIGTENMCRYQEKVPVPEKILGTVTLWFDKNVLQHSHL